jgi:hypothetical protein
MFNVSGWVRGLFRDAALGGISDAMAVLTPEGEPVPADLAELRARLAAAVAPRQLPAAPDDEPARKGKR